MNISVVITLIVVLVSLHSHESECTYAYTIRGFVADVRHQPLRFIGGLFFKKAFILKKIKLKWKLKKKFVLKKLLKKLFISWKLGLSVSAKSLLPQIFAQSWGYTEPYYHGWGWHPHGQHSYHHHPYVKLHQSVYLGRKKRAVRFPDDPEVRSSSRDLTLRSFPDDHVRSPQTFANEEFQSLGLGEQELDMLKQLPENLQREYQTEMQDLDTSASEPKEEHILEYLSYTNQFDTNHCLAKRICEVTSGNHTDNSPFDKLIVDYYNEEPNTRKDPKGSDAYVYDYAAFLGKSHRSPNACRTFFKQCPENTNSLSNFMNDLFSNDMCDPPVNQLL